MNSGNGSRLGITPCHRANLLQAGDISVALREDQGRLVEPTEKFLGRMDEGFLTFQKIKSALALQLTDLRLHRDHNVSFLLLRRGGSQFARRVMRGGRHTY